MTGIGAAEINSGFIIKRCRGYQNSRGSPSTVRILKLCYLENDRVKHSKITRK